MIQTLRKKFIIINMSLVFLVLVIVFSVICVSTYQRLQEESHAAMERALDEEESDKLEPQLEITGISEKPVRESGSTVPAFSVDVDTKGTIISSVKGNVSISETILAEAVAEVLDLGKSEGILHDLDLRFLLQDTSDGAKIAFADRSGEISSMQSLLLISLLVGVGGLIAFFFISLFLSNWVLRPLEKAWEQQRQFVADASHELKTPLTVILANIGILEAHRKDSIERQMKWVDNTKEEALQMKEMVNDLLFLAKSDAARVPRIAARLNFSDLIWSCILPFEPVAFEAGVTIQTKIDPDLMVIGDESQLKQLMAILLDNACKYAGKGGSVTVTLKRDQELINLLVHNTGATIPAEDLPHVFERFYRVDKSRVRQRGGYGLGLAIAKSIVDSHHGKITVASSEDNGTGFWVQFS